MSSIGWVDFSPRERRRTLEVLKLLEEPGTLDPLGIGRIRDTFSDLLFPGVTTIQTRARYFLIVPWLMRSLEEKSPLRDPAGRADQLERRVITTFLNARNRTDADLDGLIGGVGGAGINQLPSDIYWQGLLAYGIRRREGTPRSFTNELSHPVRPVAMVDDIERRSGFPSWWDRDLPEWDEPEFWGNPRLDLSLPEATYLAQMIRNREGTLLAHLTEFTEGLPDVPRPWDLPSRFYLHLDRSTRAALNHARLFSLVMHGATILYTLMLAELRPDQIEKETSYREIYSQWQTEVEASLPELSEWFEAFGSLTETSPQDPRLISFWSLIGGINPRIPSEGERRFIEGWIEQTLESPEAALRPNSLARQLILRREHQLKKKRAKLVNAGAREYWLGPTRVSSLDYRWSFVKRHLKDIHDGLQD